MVVLWVKATSPGAAPRYSSAAAARAASASISVVAR